MNETTRITEMVRGQDAWFVPAGPDAELVLSTRVRLARNLSGVRFTSRATDRELDEVLGEAREAATRAAALCPDDTWVMSELHPLDRTLLLERHLISSEFAAGADGRALIPGTCESVSVMVNEEDHLRIQALRGGLEIGEAWETVAAIDTALGESLDYAFRDDLGYLTACPSNVGTGLRISVLMHLPALVLSQEIRKVIESVFHVGLSVRGFYGEGSDVVGNFFQISNQITLGKAEEDLLDIMQSVVREVMQVESKARDWLWRDARSQVLDKVYRALGTLRHARVISSAEVVAGASALRLGRALGFDDMPGLDVLNRLVVQCQPAHVTRLTGRKLDQSDRRVARADLVRALVRGDAPPFGET